MRKFAIKWYITLCILYLGKLIGRNPLELEF